MIMMTIEKKQFIIIYYNNMKNNGLRCVNHISYLYLSNHFSTCISVVSPFNIRTNLHPYGPKAYHRLVNPPQLDGWQVFRRSLSRAGSNRE